MKTGPGERGEPMVFSSDEIEQFITQGFVVVREAFSPATAEECRRFVWDRILEWKNCATVVQPMIHVHDTYQGGPFANVMTPRLRSALEQLVGPGRAAMTEYFGWWPVLLPGFPGPAGWHVEGADFQHHLTSPEQALVTLFLFSDVHPEDGGSPVLPGSHRAVARMLADAEPAGLSCEELQEAVRVFDSSNVVHITGNAGDVGLMHPFLIHGFGPHSGKRARFACNPQFSLFQPMQLDRPDHDYSPVEEAIRRTLINS